MFWKKKSKSELQKRVDELEVDKKNLNDLVDFQNHALEKSAGIVCKMTDKIKDQNDQLKNWFKLGRFISSIPFKSDKKLTHERGIELIKFLQKKADPLFGVQLIRNCVKCKHEMIVSVDIIETDENGLTRIARCDTQKCDSCKKENELFIQFKFIQKDGTI